MPESLAADLDAECSACIMGAARLSDVFTRYGRDTVEAAFDAILDKTTEIYTYHNTLSLHDALPI